MSSLRASSLVSLVIAAAAAFAAVPARAELKVLTVVRSTDIGPFHGKPYREIEARMEGVAPGGAYSVPVTLAFPQRVADLNGFAVIDVVNTVTIGKPDFVLGGRPFPLARRHLGDNFLFGAGNAYVGVIWDKRAIEALGEGSIALSIDGYTILEDAAALARDPAPFFPADAGVAPASDKVVAYGYSQTGALLRGWYLGRASSAPAVPPFDGALVAAAAGLCMVLGRAEEQKCDGPLTDRGKVIALLTEGDAQFAGGGERGDAPGYRFIEIAGVSHIPASIIDFRSHGMPRQNPVGFEPAFRAALINLQQWLTGTDPPPSMAIELSDATPGELNGRAFRHVVVDSDGNAKGGLRLPHMTTALADGHLAGAPLGRYTGMYWDYEGEGFYFSDNPFFAISGTFAPFAPEKLRGLYPDHAAFVSAVKDSAEDLAAKRYILPDDARAYVEAADATDFGRP